MIRAGACGSRHQAFTLLSRPERLLETCAMLWIDQAFNRERGRDLAMALDHPAR